MQVYVVTMTNKETNSTGKAIILLRRKLVKSGAFAGKHIFFAKISKVNEPDFERSRPMFKYTNDVDWIEAANGIAEICFGKKNDIISCTEVNVNEDS